MRLVEQASHRCNTRRGKPLLDGRQALRAGHCQGALQRRTPEEKQRMLPACAPQPHTEPHAPEHHRQLLQGNSCTTMQDCATTSQRDSRGSARRRGPLASPRAAAAGSPWSPARAAAHQHTLLCHPRRRYAYASESGARQHLPKPQSGASRVLRGAVSVPAPVRQAELLMTALQHSQSAQRRLPHVHSKTASGVLNTPASNLGCCKCHK